MEALLALVLVAAMMWGSYKGTHALAGSRKWHRFGIDLGLTPFFTRLSGTKYGFDINVLKPNPDDLTFRFSVASPRLGTLSARRTDAVARVSAVLGAERLTGDRDFDKQVVIRGNELEVAAALTDTGRAALLKTLKRGVTLSEGILQVKAYRRELTVDRMRRHFRSLTRAAKKFSIPKGKRGLKQRLIDNAEHDTVPCVRKRNLDLLASHFKGETEVAALFQRALLDPDPEVRLAAASHAELDAQAESTPSTPRLLSMLTGLVQGDHNDELRGKAMTLLAERFPNSSALFHELVHDRAASVREPAAAALARKGLRVETGGLTLADAEGGELSLSREAGALPREEELIEMRAAGTREVRS